MLSLLKESKERCNMQKDLELKAIDGRLVAKRDKKWFNPVIQFNFFQGDYIVAISDKNKKIHFVLLYHSVN